MECPSLLSHWRLNFPKALLKILFLIYTNNLSHALETLSSVLQINPYYYCTVAHPTDRQSAAVPLSAVSELIKCWSDKWSTFLLFLENLTDSLYRSRSIIKQTTFFHGIQFPLQELRMHKFTTMKNKVRLTFRTLPFIGTK